MRRILVLATMAVVPFVAGSLHGADTPTSGDFYVASGGSDDNAGTVDKPFATLARARDAVRSRIAAGLKGDVTVLVRGGTYELSETLTFGPEDSGTDEHAVTYAAYPGEQVVISGGRRISRWQQRDGGLWTARASGVKEGQWYFRHLFVNGRRATRARTPNVGGENPHWQITGATLSPDLASYTLTIAPERLGAWTNVSDMEIMVAGNWAINRKRIAAVDRTSGTITLAPPHASGHNAIRPRPGRWCYFENARELLDISGEWYLDRSTGVLNYMPREGEDASAAEVVAPVLERLIEVKGTPDQSVRNLHFRGLSLHYAGWQLPEHGYLGIQACHFTSGRDWKRPWARIPAAVCFNFAEGCSIRNGTVAHIGGSGIELVDCCRENIVEGNHVYDVSGNGVMLGGPKEEGRVPRGNRIANNYVHACGVEYYGAVGIWVGFAEGAQVAHNLVHDLPYTGISVGWQWNPKPTPCKNNVVEKNHVHDVMKALCDGGCIYTLGFQPGTVVRGNHLHDVKRSLFAQGAPNNGMFIDQGSKGYLFERNVIYNTSAQLVRFNQCSRDWHTWRDNHFGKEADVKESGKEIIAAAGLAETHRRRLLDSERESKTGIPAFKVLPENLIERAVTLRGRALEESKAYEYLAALTTEVGPRFAGTANDRRAVQWAQRKLEELGFSNVRAEQVIVPCWQRGEAIGEITTPPRQKFRPLALGGSVGTPPGGIEAEIIEVSGLEKLAQLKQSEVAGKVVFLNQPMTRTKDGTGYRKAVPKRRSGPTRAAALGAVAVLIRSVATSTTNHAHTGMTHYEEGVSKIPAASLSNPEADLLETRIRKSAAVRFKLQLGCRYLPDRKSANVIGEILGRELPREIVLLVAHLDSWDVGTGALDDGAGCAIVTEVARLIDELEPAPRRTIRVLLTANEEFGLSGALAYSERYAQDMNNHVLGLEADFGADRVWLMRSRVAKEALPAIRDLALLLAPLGISYTDNRTLGGADLIPMMRYQLPLLELLHDATNYFDASHSANDTIDKVNPKNLAQCVAAYAVAALVAAEIEEGFGRAPKFRGRLPSPLDRLSKGKPLYR